MCRWVSRFVYRSSKSDRKFDVTVGHIEDIIMGELKNATE